ncbi:GtrA family protein [Candidatus Dojkabacteria bacterium]|nr:GtrA family protein [Candidatus Dojkabacteria bacterium]
MNIIKKVKDTFFTPRFIKFFITGITAFAIDFALYSIGVKAGLPFLLANSISVSIAIVVNYVINRFWVWQSEEKKVALEFGKFMLVQGFNFLSNNLFLLLFVAINVSAIVLNIASLISENLRETFGFVEGDDGNKLLAKFFATSIQLITSFLFYKFFVFRVKKK